MMNMKGLVRVTAAARYAREMWITFWVLTSGILLFAAVTYFTQSPLAFDIWLLFVMGNLALVGISSVLSNLHCMITVAEARRRHLLHVV